MFIWFNLREALIVMGFVAAVRVLVANPAPAPSPNSTPASAGFIDLNQPVKVKIAYGEITLTAAMRLPVVSSDATSVRVNYMGEVQIIPIAAARFENSTSEPLDAGVASTTPKYFDTVRLAGILNARSAITGLAPTGLRLPNARRRHYRARIAAASLTALHRSGRS